MTSEELMRMTVKDLRALAERHGVAGHGKLRKDQLIGVLVPLVVKETTAKALPTPGAAPAGSSNTTSSAKPAHQGPDPGLPIPETYGLDRLVLLVQDPSHIFAYWEISPQTYARVAGEAGQGAASVLVLHTPSGAEQREVDLRGGNYYLAVAPGATYRAELALRARSGKLHTLAVSNAVATPAQGPSPRTDATWMEVDETFHELLAIAGLPGHEAGGGTSVGGGVGSSGVGGASSLSRLSARTLEAKVLSHEEAVARGLAEAIVAGEAGGPGAAGGSSGELPRRARQQSLIDSLAPGLAGGSLSSSTLSSTSLSSSTLGKR